MRGHASRQIPMFYMINVEAELPKQHPLRGIKHRADAILRAISGILRKRIAKWGVRASRRSS